MTKFFQNWRQLLSVQVGGAICLPIIMIGQAIGSSFGLISSLIVVGIGNLFLMGIGILTSIMSVKKRKSTSAIAANYFGKKGGQFFSSLLTFSMVGWFGIQLNYISESILHILAICGLSIVINPIFVNIGLGILMTVGALFGIRGIGILSTITMPLLIGVLIFSFFSAPLSMLTLAPIGAAISLQGISMIIGGGIAGVIDFPTYFQHAKSKKDGIIVSSILFGLVLPFIEIVGICLGVCFPQSSLLTSLIAGGGIIWSFVVCLFSIFAGWTTNNTNIYSANINSKEICPKFSSKTRTLIFGLIGTLLSTFGFLSHLSIVLNVMGILLGSMGATTLASYLMDSFLRCEINKRGQIFNLISFVISIIVGLLTFVNIFHLSQLPLLDAFLTAFITTVGFRYINNKKVITKEIDQVTS